MYFYIVTMRRIIEWEQLYEAENADIAADLARLEAHHGTVVDEHVIVQDVEALDAKEMVD
jgi:hypothetical protein